MAKQNTAMSTPVTAPPAPRPVSQLLHEISFIFLLCLAQFLSLAAMNQTVAPLLILAKYFDIHDYGNLSWFSAAYSMTVGTFMLPAGRIGDMYGHKRIFIVGWAWFAVWSLVCGFPNHDQLVLFSVCRALQGIGPALVIPNAIALIGRTLPVGFKRNMAFAAFGASGPTGAALGAVMAALVSETIGWHWCFWLLAITCALLVPISYYVVPSPEKMPRMPRGAPQAVDPDPPKFDWPGAVTGVLGLVLVNFALNQAPLVGWNTPYIPVLLVLGFLSLFAFVWVELKVATQPIIPIRGLQRNAGFTLACVFAGWSSHGIWVYYLYIFLEHLRGHSALLTSAETCPVAITGLGFAFLTVWLMRRFPVSWVMFAAMFFFTFGSLLMAITPLNQTYWANTFIAIVLMPGAMNLSFPAATILLSSALPKEKQGIAASLVATVVNYSISCGLGFAGSIHKHSLGFAGERAEMAGPPPPLSISNEKLVAVRLQGLRAAYWFSVALGGLGMLIAALFILVQNAEKAAEKAKEADAERRGSATDESEKPSAGWSTPVSPSTPRLSTSEKGDVTKFYLGDRVITVPKDKETSV
ncbi:major facilitator superfamily-domain-containing protein [Lasiosphaeria hispida]|uniref:Major facilitator superfamily-domain-containing protein n=1 Tax=Lasiosphaeria hispida TaxID=260671 RepID=A0AAJ0H526_9PEZI|nr:major facilitator superfamily-domain-containing protein [Lasiosphaeria hispida]